MTAPDIIKQLVERFERNHDSYRSGKYNETQLRHEQSPRMPQEKESLAREIEMTDRQIDGLVSPTGTMYELYGLTEEEIKIVEGG
jgi:hypothetical protein